MSTFRIRILPFAAAPLLMLVPSSHAAPFDYDLSPKLLSSSQADDTTVGVEYSVEGRHSAGWGLSAGIGDLGFDLRAKSEGTVALDEDVNPNPLVTSANVDLRLTTGAAAQDDFNNDPNANPGGARAFSVGSFAMNTPSGRRRRDVMRITRLYCMRVSFLLGNAVPDGEILLLPVQALLPGGGTEDHPAAQGLNLPALGTVVELDLAGAFHGQPAQFGQVDRLRVQAVGDAVGGEHKGCGVHDVRPNTAVSPMTFSASSWM